MFQFILMTILFDILIAFILGFLFFLIINLLIVKYSKDPDVLLFTEDISTDIITYTKDYQELLRTNLGNNAPYFILYGKTQYHILASHWTVFDIIKWLELLNSQDYAVSIELILKSSEGLYLRDPRVILSTEFMINNHSNHILISSLISTELNKVFKMFDCKESENYYILIQYTELTISN